MGFFSKKDDQAREELSTIRSTLQFNFFDVKSKISSLFQWITYFYNKEKEQDSRLEKLELHLSQIPSTKEQIKQIIDEHYSQQEVLDKIAAVERKLNHLYFSNQGQNLPVEEIKERINALEKKKDNIKSTLREKMLKKITRNSKEYIKTTVLSILRKYNRISAFRLKEMIVEEQGLCSKSSFYRILDEIEREGEFGSTREGKEKIFFSKGIDEKQIIE